MVELFEYLNYYMVPRKCYLMEDHSDINLLMRLVFIYQRIELLQVIQYCYQ
jgi:hypothetical protein